MENLIKDQFGTKVVTEIKANVELKDFEKEIIGYKEEASKNLMELIAKCIDDLQTQNTLTPPEIERIVIHHCEENYKAMVHDQLKKVGLFKGSVDEVEKPSDKIGLKENESDQNKDNKVDTKEQTTTIGLNTGSIETIERNAIEVKGVTPVGTNPKPVEKGEEKIVHSSPEKNPLDVIGSLNISGKNDNFLEGEKIDSKNLVGATLNDDNHDLNPVEKLLREQKIYNPDLEVNMSEEKKEEMALFYEMKGYAIAESYKDRVKKEKEKSKSETSKPESGEIVFKL